MTATAQPTQAELAEARCRFAMAQVPPAKWGNREARAAELVYVDGLLDAYNEATCHAVSPAPVQ